MNSFHSTETKIILQFQAVALFQSSSSTTDEVLPPIVAIHYEEETLLKWHSPETVTGQPGAPGEMGKPVVIPPEQSEKRKELFKEHEFDIMASDMISLNRSLADARHPK